MKTMILFLVFVLSTVFSFAQNLTLDVRGIDHVKGYLYVGIYNSKETFMKKPISGFRVEVKRNEMSIPCKGLPAGTYAISLFQDENGNNMLDTGSFGRPLGKFGFSNDAEGVMGAPSYEKCRFDFKRDTTMVVHLK